MSLKKGGSPETLPLTLTVSGQGSTDKVNIVYHNRKSSEFEAHIKLPDMTLGGMIPYVVQSWDLDFPLTTEGVSEMEDEYPGMINIIIAGFGQARLKAAEKN